MVFELFSFGGFCLGKLVNGGGGKEGVWGDLLGLREVKFEYGNIVGGNSEVDWGLSLLSVMIVGGKGIWVMV